jgi:hypothetical protein
MKSMKGYPTEEAKVTLRLYGRLAKIGSQGRKMTSQKWCIQCGTQVDMRRDFQLKESLCQKMGVVNPGYKYVHRDCNEALKKDLSKGLPIRGVRIQGL